MITPKIREFLKNALLEDINHCDVTTELTIPRTHTSVAYIIAKSDFILAGLVFVKELFLIYDRTIEFIILKDEGTEIKKGEPIAEIKGNSRSILVCERTGLNLLQRLCGIATLTKSFVEQVRRTQTKILDTRKTTPCMRYLEKYAVRIGGGYNHRMGLYDGILIKDNHIKIAGGTKKAVISVKNNRTTLPPTLHLMKIEVEVSNLDEVIEAIEAGVDVIMLDNMEIEDMKKAVALIRQKAPSILIEASGNVTLENVKTIAETGIDFISVGALTHSVASVDISLKIMPLWELVFVMRDLDA